jgi:hypothetical protein
MKKIILTALLGLPFSTVFAQTVDTSQQKLDTTNANFIYRKVDIESQFPGGDAGYGNYVRQAVIKKFDFLMEKHAQGKVEAQFIVNIDGSIDSVTLIKQTGTALDDFAKEVFLTMPLWTPAYLNGHKVRSYRRQKITVTLPD